MALPQQVLERLNEAPTTTPGWSWGLLSFTGGIFLIALAVYLGLLFGYEPYLNGQIANLNQHISQLSNSVSSQDQASLATFYSQITNMKSILANHVVFSHFFSWLEKNTEANVHYTNLSFASGNQVTLAGVALTEADANQQLAIFESAPGVQSVNFSGVTQESTGGWGFNATLRMNPFSGL